MNRLIALAVLTGATLAHAQTTPASAPGPSTPAKKELVAKVVAMQQPGVENLARGIVERPAMQMMQAVGNVLQTQVAPDKREAIGKSIEADIKKYVEEGAPLLKERAQKIGPATLTPILEEKFTEDELKQLAAWLDSPVNRKYQQVAQEMQQALVQKLVAEAGPLLDPKLKALDQKVRATLGVPAQGQPASGAAAPKAAAPAAKKASAK